MKKMLYVAFIFFAFQTVSLAIDWLQVTTPANRVAYIDLDSITEHGHFYFYNIKFKNPNHDDFVVMTMQSSKASPMSARLKAYTESEYNALDGDYSNIYALMTDKLEPVTYQSVVNTCYKKVKHIKEMQSANSIIINSDTDEVD